jgi:hypothetical protein
MTKHIQQRSIWLILFSVLTLLILSLGLTGCGSNAPEEQPSAAILGEPVVAMAMEEVVVDEVVVETAVTPTEEPIDECLACHIDKEMLIATSDPIEEVISENEGEG